ncbi:MAG: hypothetical protein R2761_28005 [Acidimicrobiales bacterium]
MATDLSVIPYQAGLIPLCTPLTAKFAQSDGQEHLRRTWDVAVNGCLIVFGTPLVLLAVLAGPAVSLVLGDAWLSASGLVAGAALSALPAFVAFLLTPLAIARYHSRALFERTVVTSLVLVPVTILGATRYGAYGTIIANGISNVAATLISMRAAARITGQPVTLQCWGLHRTIIGYAALAAPAWVLSHAFFGLAAPATAATTALLFGLTLAIGSGLLAQALSMWLLWILEGRPPGVEASLADLISTRLVRRRVPVTVN